MNDQPTPHEEPVRVLSDLHLGHPASRLDHVEALRPLISGAKTVIFNGDTCEQITDAWLPRAEEKLQQLRSLCHEEGAHAIFLAGNHDPKITDQGWVELWEGRVLVMHGHAIYPRVAPWSHEYLRQKIEIKALLNRRREENPEPDLAYQWETTRIVTDMLIPEGERQMGRKGRKYLWSAIWPPERCLNILRVWLTMGATADRFLERFAPEAKVLVYGHFHRSEVCWTRTGRMQCNTGAFMRGARSLVVELADGMLQVKRVQSDDGSYRLGAVVETLRFG